MLIRPHDAPIDDDEWRNYRRRDAPGDHEALTHLLRRHPPQTAT